MKNQCANNLGNALKRLMFEKNITQADLAKKLGVAQATIYKIVSGKSTRPHASTLAALAKYFDVTIEQLKEGLEQKPSQEQNIDIGKYLTTQPKTILIPLISWEDLKKPSFPVFVDCNEHVVGLPPLGENSFAIPMNDTSMEPQFSLGTTLIFDPSRVAMNNSFVLVWLQENSNFVFRQLQMDGEHRFITPLNTIKNLYDMELLTEENKIIAVLAEARRNYINNDFNITPVVEDK